MNARISLLLAWLLPASALAGWEALSVPGTPVEVQLLDAGTPYTFAVSTTTQVLIIREGPTGLPEVAVSAGASQSTGVIATANGCVGTLNASGFYNRMTTVGPTDGSCVPSTAQPLSTDGLRVVGTSTGSGYALSEDTSLGRVHLHHVPGGATPAPIFNPLPLLSATASKSLHSLVVDGVDLGLLGTHNGVNETLHLAVDGGYASVVVVTPFAQRASDLTLFRDGAKISALTPRVNGLVELIDDVRVPSPNAVRAPISTPAGSPALSLMSINTGSGDPPFGDGLGLAVGTDGGSWLAAVPNPAAAGRTWQLATKSPPVDPGAPRRLRCLGSSLCVYLNGAASPSLNVGVWRNAAPPPAPALGTLDVQEGQTLAASYPSADPDGEALFVTWSTDAGYPGISVISPDGRDVSFDAGVNPILCGRSTTVFNWTVTVSDGMAGHTVSSVVPVRVRHTVPPLIPTVSPPRHTVLPGGTPVVYTPSANATGCPPSGFEWSVVSGGPLVTSVDGTGRLTATPPITQCAPSPRIVQLEARAVDQADASVAATADLEVLSWGTPDAAFPPGAAVSIVSPTDGGVTVTPEGTHACAGLGGFPGLSTRWELASGGAGGLLFSGGALPQTTSALRLDAPACWDGGFELRAVHSVDTTAFSGPPSTVRVDVVRRFQPLEELGVAITVDGGPTRLGGTVSVSNQECPAPLQAEVVVRRDGGEVARGSFDAGSAWELAIADSCEGGEVEVEAQVSGRDAGPALASIVLPTALAGFSVEVVPLTVSCGAPARGELIATRGASDCPRSVIGWRQRSGPPLRGLPAEGDRIALETESASLSDLIGATVELEASGDGGPGTEVDVPVSGVISAEPFLVSRYRTEQPLVQEGGVVAVAITVSNPSSCGVSEVQYRERLDGLRYVEGSARLDGVAATATVDGDVLLFEGIAVAEGARAELSYLARPRLFRESAPSGAAVLRGVALSEPTGLSAQPVPSGCGCEVSGGGAGLGLLALWAARSRRGSRRA
jgi:hypothetical protein